MSVSVPPDPSPSSADYRSFVLRVRHDRSGEEELSIVDLEDVQSSQTTRFISLEGAFSHIRHLLGVDRSDAETPPPTRPH